MLIPFLALQQYILNAGLDVQICRIWNDNLSQLNQGEDLPYDLPAIFVDFPDYIKWDQLGNGVQIVDPLEIRFHYIMNQLDAQDGTEDQNLDVFTQLNLLRDKLQDWMPTTFTIGSNDQFYSKFAGTYDIPFGVFTRTGEIQDKTHSNLYHFIQVYNTSWVDSSRVRPIGGFPAGNLNYELDSVTEWSNTALYVVDNYVWYNTGIYKCILNTTSAHEPPTNGTYWVFVRNR